MQIIKTKFKDLKIIKLKKNSDKRGYLKETFRKNKIQSKYLPFSYYVNSKKNVVRGFHFQYKFQQVKYITVLVKPQTLLHYCLGTYFFQE